MPARASLIYIAEKHRFEMDELRYKYYIADMLWAPANGKNFKEAERYIELEDKAKKQKPLKKITKQSVIDRFSAKIKSPTN